MTKTVTARYLARHGVPEGVTFRSPYTGKVCNIVAAKESGSRVTLITKSGNTIFVPATQQLQCKIEKKGQK